MMIDKITSFTLNLIKTNVSIVLIFYASGFLSFIAYYRVLGLPYISGNAQTYAELAGKNIVVILQTFILLISEPNRLIAIFNDSDWAGNALYIWLFSIFLLTIILSVLKLFAQKPIVINIRQKPVTKHLQILLIAIAVFTTFHIQIQPFYATNVLQPINFLVIYKDKEPQNIVNFEQQTKKTQYQKRLGLYNQYQNKSQENNSKNIKNIFFSTPKTNDELGNDSKRINALMLIILIASITTVALVLYRQNRTVQWLLFLFALAQAVLIPFNYGILGTSYQYPVVSLQYTENSKPVDLQAVFLLAKSDDNLIIYDRLGFFQISYIPKSSVINLKQLFTGSPFSNCDQREFKPCEYYAIKQ
jgi:hypothetical protein